MYNDELDTVLEDAYDDGYTQALMDMDIYDDIVEEDVDIYGDYDYDEAMEGPAREYRKKMNAGKSREEIQKEREYKSTYDLDPKYSNGTHDRYASSGRRHFKDKKSHPVDAISQRNLRDKHLKYFAGGTGSTNYSKLIGEDGEKLRKKYADKKAMDEFEKKYDQKYGHELDKRLAQNPGLDPIAKEALRRKYERLYDEKYREKYRKSDEYRDAYLKHNAKALDLQSTLDDNIRRKKYSL